MTPFPCVARRVEQRFVRPAETEAAAAALRDVERDHVIAGDEARDPGPHLLHDAAALVAEHRRKQPRRIAAAHRVRIGVTHPRGHEAHETLARTRALEVDGVDLERAAGLEADRRTHLHAPGP
jgi:hypothetical protein